MSFAILSSSTTDVIGSCSLLPELYKLIEQKPLGTDSNLLKKLLIFLSKPSAVETDEGDPYTVTIGISEGLHKNS